MNGAIPCIDDIVDNLLSGAWLASTGYYFEIRSSSPQEDDERGEGLLVYFLRANTFPNHSNPHHGSGIGI